MSTDRAKSYHSINIGEKNTWDDWFLVPSSRPIVNPPQIKTHYVSVPGRDGDLDLTESLAGRPVYSNRNGSWEFVVVNPTQVAALYDKRFVYAIGDFCIYNNRLYRCTTRAYKENWDSSHWTQIYVDNRNLWQSRYTAIMQYLQGEEFDVVLDDDPDFFYHGRLAVNAWDSDEGNSTIVISYNLEPYKRDPNSTESRWLWDPFCFKYPPPVSQSNKGDQIRSYKNLQVKGTTPITYELNLDMAVSPIFKCSAKGMKVTYNGVTYNLKRGVNEMTQFTIPPGEAVQFIFTGTGRVTIQATGGLL